MPTAVSVRDLEVHHDQTVALRATTLEVPGGSTCAVIGPNGAGKSTLLRSIAGLERPVRGTIDTGADDVALVLQSTDVDRSVPVSVRDVVRMARYPRVGLLRRFRPVDRAAVEGALDRLGLTDLAERQLHELSGGQRQRTLVAQGLAQGAGVLLLDEPVTGLDVVSREVILDVIAEERDAGHAVIMTTHDLDDARRCDQVVLLATAPVAIGPPDVVLQAGPLGQAFGGQIGDIGGQLFLDDPHHVH